MARIEPVPAERMTPAQAEACAEVVAGPRGKVPAPMVAWLRNPELARRGQRVGELLRFATSLAPAETELAILVCARHWTSHHEWTAHKALALKAGVDPAVVSAIAARATPKLADPRLACIHQTAQAILATGRLDPDRYGSALAILGETGLVELISLLGYYSWVALTLNVFELGLPENAAAELSDPDITTPPT